MYFESDDAILPQTFSSMASAGCAVIVVGSRIAHWEGLIDLKEV